MAGCLARSHGSVGCSVSVRNGSAQASSSGRVPVLVPRRQSRSVPQLHTAPPRSQATTRRLSAAAAAPPADATTTTATDAAPTQGWWTKNNPPNMIDVKTVQELVDALSDYQDRLVVVDFYAPWCNACRSLFPKLCKMVAAQPDIVVLKVNFEDNKSVCKTLGIKVLPFFHLYKGAEGRVDAFSCSVSKIQRLKDALDLHSGSFCSLEPVSSLSEFPEILAHPEATAGSPAADGAAEPQAEA